MHGCTAAPYMYDEKHNSFCLYLCSLFAASVYFRVGWILSKRGNDKIKITKKPIK